MKRAFLFGLGWCLALMTLGVVKQEGGRLLSLGLPTAAAELTGVALVIFGVPSAFAFLAGQTRAPNKSRLDGVWRVDAWVLDYPCAVLGCSLGHFGRQRGTLTTAASAC